MNILPKKSWHVRSRKNIERVRRDEAEAERLNRIEQDRILQVEQEVRLRELRARAGLPVPEPKHFNLFEDYQDRQESTNKDYDAEKNQDDAIRQKSLNIFNKLGRSEDANQPWYCSGSRPKANLGDLKRECIKRMDISSELTDPIKSKSSQLITSMYDPMTAIKEAEEIVKLKRQKMLSSGASISGIVKPAGPPEEFPSKGIREKSSSPEIIDMIDPKGSSERRHRKNNKKNKKPHKHKKSRKRHKHGSSRRCDNSRQRQEKHNR